MEDRERDILLKALGKRTKSWELCKADAQRRINGEIGSVLNAKIDLQVAEDALERIKTKVKELTIHTHIISTDAHGVGTHSHPLPDEVGGHVHNMDLLKPEEDPEYARTAETVIVKKRKRGVSVGKLK